MEFEWDAKKAASNLKNHGVDFADAASVLLEDMALTIRDDSVDEEDRFVTLGADALGRLLVVVYTWRGDVLRLISARLATAGERRRYERKR
ncbi:MAG: BrnT family toxin [Vicinamibacteria bacterium]